MNNFKKILLTSFCASFSFFVSQGSLQWKKFCLENENIPLSFFRDFKIDLPDFSDKKEWKDLLEEVVDFQDKNLDPQEETTDKQKSNLFFKEKLYQNHCIFHNIPSSFLDTPEKKKDFSKKAQECIFLKLFGVLWENKSVMKNFAFLCTTFKKGRSFNSSISQKKLTYEKALPRVYKAFKKALSEKEYDFLLNSFFFPQGISTNTIVPLLNMDFGYIFNYDNKYRSFFDKNLEEINYDKEEEVKNFIKKLKARSLLEDFFCKKFFCYDDIPPITSFNKNALEIIVYKNIDKEIKDFLANFKKKNVTLSTNSIEAEKRKITLKTFMKTKGENIKYFYFFTTLVAVINRLNEEEFLDFRDFIVKNSETYDYFCETVFAQQIIGRIEKFTKNIENPINHRYLIQNMETLIFAQKRYNHMKLKLLLKQEPNSIEALNLISLIMKKYHPHYVILFEKDFPKEDIFVDVYKNISNKKSIMQKYHPRFLSRFEEDSLKDDIFVDIYKNISKKKFLNSMMKLLKEDVENVDNDILLLKNNCQTIEYDYPKEEKQRYLTRIQTRDCLEQSISFHQEIYQNITIEDLKKDIFLYKDDRKGSIFTHKDSPFQEPITRYYTIDQLSLGLCLYIYKHSYGKKTFTKKTKNKMLEDIKCLRIYLDFIHNKYNEALEKNFTDQEKENLSWREISNPKKFNVLEMRDLEPFAVELFSFLSNFGYLHQIMINHISYFFITEELEKEKKLKDIVKDILGLYSPLKTRYNKEIMFYFFSYLFPIFFEVFEKRSFIYKNCYKKNINCDNTLTI